MRAISLLFLLFCIIINQLCNAQYLKKGDQMREFSSNQTLNTQETPIRLSDYRGKLLILDFWDTRCLGCLLSFPKVDSLQQQFKDKVQFVMVNPEPKEYTLQFFEKRKKIHRPSVPMITGDSSLISWFNFEGKPFHVWVDSTGRITQTTGGYNTTKNNIEKYFQYNSIILKQKTGKRALIGDMLNDAWKPNTIFASYLGSCNDLRDTSSSPNTGMKCFSETSISILALYQLLFELETGNRFKSEGLTLLQSKNKAKFDRKYSGEGIDEWRENNCYTYKIYVPEEREKDLYKLAISDLDRYFNCHSEIKLMAVNCLVLTKLPGSHKPFSTKGGNSVDSLYFSNERGQFESEFRYLKNSPFSLFSGRLGSQFSSRLDIPFIDETGITGNIDISFPGKLLDTDSINIWEWNAALKEEGLQIIKTRRKMKVLMIHENE